MTLQIGDSAPDFNLPNQDGELVTLESFRGERVVIYFYPKDDTPGCTKEACNFRDLWERFEAHGIKVLGISKDGATSHAKFIKKHQLPFILLSDSQCGLRRSNCLCCEGRSPLMRPARWACFNAQAARC